MNTATHPRSTNSVPLRLPRPAPVPIPGGVLGRLVFKPWLDAIILRVVVSGYLPLSRGWAAARKAGGSVDAFREHAPYDWRVSSRLEHTLGTIERRDHEYRQALTAWDNAFFGNEDVPHAKLVTREIARRLAAHRLMAARILLIPWIRRFSPVRWQIADQATVAKRHGARLDGSEPVFPTPPATMVHASRKVPSTLGREYWLRFRAPSPRLDEDVLAHVYEPNGVSDPPSLIALHGIAIEPEMLKQISEPTLALVQRGFRVIRTCAPEHARRTPEGYYGGETIVARGLLGFIELFEAWVGEVAILIEWVRQFSTAPVALAGLSLGSLTAQLAAAVHEWPANLHPDAIYLTATSGDVVETTLRGSMASAFGAERVIKEHGWSPEEVEPWRSLLEPQEQPVVSPDRIVMARGMADTVTPYPGGANLAMTWEVPPQNLFVRPMGHFTLGLDTYNDTAPIRRLAEIIENLAG